MLQQSDVDLQRRRYERIALPEKIIGTLDMGKAVVIDISISGALVAHQKRVDPGETVLLQFDWRGYSISIIAEVVRTFLFRRSTKTAAAVYRSGLRFLRFEQEEGAASLRSMISELVSRALDERRANARGIPPEMAASRQHSARKDGYVCYRLVDGKWQRRRSLEPVQPPDGFSISSDDDREAAMLCDVYEHGSEKDREMIRSMASHSFTEVTGFPVRRFDP